MAPRSLPLLATLAVAALGCHAAPNAAHAGPGAEAGEPDGAHDVGPDASAPEAATDGAEAPEAAASLDPGLVGLRRLSDVEYANTIVYLLGITLPNGTVFSPAALSNAPLDGFDNMIDAPPVSTSRYRDYFSAAVTLAALTFSEPALATRIVTCVPASATDTTCDASIVRAFGLRAWRRPLDDDEVDGLVALARAARDGGESFVGSIQRVVAALLASESFIYRVETDPAADPTRVHPLTTYELASRLSYLLWSSMPDDTLFGLAASGDLARDDVLPAQVTRMLADPRASGFVRNFAGQWLGFRALDTHDVDVASFPAWNDDLRRAMQDEASLYVSEFLQHDRTLDGFLTAQLHFVDDALADIYGLAAPGVTDHLVPVTAAPNGREGYLGLAAFLTSTSGRAASSATRRGATILESLLCVELGPTPASGMDVVVGTPREELAALASDLVCASCHLETENIGFGLESFDAVGQFRTTYASGDVIDATGSLPDGTTFVGLSALADLLQRDPRFLDCAARKALVYALGRPLAAADGVQVARIRAAWDRGGLTFRGLLGAIVTSDAFRLRRGESP